MLVRDPDSTILTIFANFHDKLTALPLVNVFLGAHNSTLNCEIYTKEFNLALN